MAFIFIICPLLASCQIGASQCKSHCTGLHFVPWTVGMTLIIDLLLYSVGFLLSCSVWSFALLPVCIKNSIPLQTKHNQSRQYHVTFHHHLYFLHVVRSVVVRLRERNQGFGEPTTEYFLYLIQSTVTLSSACSLGMKLSKARATFKSPFLYRVCRKKQKFDPIIGFPFPLQKLFKALVIIRGILGPQIIFLSQPLPKFFHMFFRTILLWLVST